MSDEWAKQEIDDAEAQLQRELAELRSQRDALGDGTVPEPDPGLVPEPGGVWELNTAGSEREPYMFKLDGEDMYAAPVMPAGYVIDGLRRRGETVKNKDEQVERIMGMLQALLFPESWEILRDRMYDPESPIEFEEVAKILNHLTTVVYRNPTRQSPDSPPAPLNAGETSTAGASPATSTTTDSTTTPAS